MPQSTTTKNIISYMECYQRKFTFTASVTILGRRKEATESMYGYISVWATAQQCNNAVSRLSIFNFHSLCLINILWIIQTAKGNYCLSGKNIASWCLYPQQDGLV